MKRITGTLLLAAVFLMSGFGMAEAAALRGNPGTKTYHVETCKYAKAQGAKAAFGSMAEAQNSGFIPCAVCLPDEGSPPCSMSRCPASTTRSRSWRASSS